MKMLQNIARCGLRLRTPIRHEATSKCYRRTWSLRYFYLFMRVYISRETWKYYKILLFEFLQSISNHKASNKKYNITAIHLCARFNRSISMLKCKISLVLKSIEWKIKTVKTLCDHTANNYFKPYHFWSENFDFYWK